MAERGKKKRKKRKRTFYDYSLLFTIVFLLVYGLIMIYSASSYTAQIQKGDAAYFAVKQAEVGFVGFIVMLAISKGDYHVLRLFPYLGYVVSILLMFLTAFTPLGVALNGKKRWIHFGPIQFQPAEVVKIALILFLASEIVKAGLRINERNTILRLIGLCIPLAVLVANNNLSSGIIICGIAFVMLFVAVKIQWPFYLILASGISVVALLPRFKNSILNLPFLKGYQMARIQIWLDPFNPLYSESGGLQVTQGLYAIGSGGFFGKGLGQSLQKLGFVPEPANDMIFSIICEELGLFGAVSLILLFIFLIYRMMVIAQNAPDLFGAMLVVGVMAQVTIQVVLNIAVVTNTIPNTGVSLPFISYGGTSLGFLMLEMGVVLGVSNQIKLEPDVREEA